MLRLRLASVTRPLNSITSLSLVFSLSGLRPSSKNNILRLFLFLRRSPLTRTLYILKNHPKVVKKQSAPGDSPSLTLTTAYTVRPRCGRTTRLRTRAFSSHQNSPYSKKTTSRVVFLLYGALWAIRTPDPQLRRLLLYPAELRAHRLFKTENYIKKRHCQSHFVIFFQ